MSQGLFDATISVVLGAVLTNLDLTSYSPSFLVGAVSNYVHLLMYQGILFMFQLQWNWQIISCLSKNWYHIFDTFHISKTRQLSDSSF